VDITSRPSAGTGATGPRVLGPDPRNPACPTHQLTGVIERILIGVVTTHRER
jgi:hypothetical protein